MGERPYILLSCATSIDGYLDDATDNRLLLSNADDFDRVDEIRASVDAILVGANTIRRDNPRLSVRSPARRAARVAAGRPETPLKVALTSAGSLPAGAAFRSDGDSVVYEATDVAAVVDALAARGVRRLLVEGGGQVFTSFLAAGLVDELRIAIAPFFVGDSRAPRFIHDGQFRWTAESRATLVSVEALGNIAVHRYLLNQSAVDRYWLERAIELSRQCPPVESAFNVGAVIVDTDGDELSSGYSRETDDKVHAEESALAKLGANPRLAGATVYSSLEPCGQRLSRPRSCSQLILDAGVRRVVFAMREPPIFVPGDGAEKLEAGGVMVVELGDLAAAVREVNGHLLKSQ